MLADVTNRARGARGFQLADGTIRFVEPGAAVTLDLADHPLHRVWERAGDVVIAPSQVAAKPPPDDRPPAVRSRDKVVRRTG